MRKNNNETSSGQAAVPQPPAAFRSQNSKEIHKTASYEEVKALTQQGREAMKTRNLSRAVSHALRRGESLAEKKSAWPFDFYQCTNMFPVDYKYWTRPVETSCGPSRLVAMHAHAYTGMGEEFAADQVGRSASLPQIVQLAMDAFLSVQSDPARLGEFASKKRDEWGGLQQRLIGSKPQFR